MKRFYLYPTFINWTVIWVCLFGIYFENKIYGVPFGLIWILFFLGCEWLRVSRIVNQLASEVTVDQIQKYFSGDDARRSLPWRDQVRGINQETGTKNEPECV